MVPRSWIPRLEQLQVLGEHRGPEEALTTQHSGFTLNFALLGLQSSQDPAGCPRNKWDCAGGWQVGGLILGILLQ